MEIKQYKLQMPGKVYAGENSLDNIKDIVRDAKKIAILTDKGIRDAGLLDNILSILQKVNAEFSVIDTIPSEPAYQDVQIILEQFRSSEADFIIAVGGGSVMDTTKVVSVLSSTADDVVALYNNQDNYHKCVKTLMIPTTAGTGAETTPIAIITFPEKELKLRIVNDGMMADYCILDPSMIRNLPRKIAASTGVDALCHAIECFTSNKANPFSDMYALNALDMILNNIEAACDDPDATQAKVNMQIASFYAGVAITAASGTTAVHALSYPLGGRYHIPHGISNAILLMPVMRFNEPACRDKLAAAYRRCIHDTQTCTTAESQSKYIIERLDSIVKHLDIPTDLNDFGVTRDDLEFLTKGGMEITSLLSNNMRKITEADARAIYEEVL